MGVIVIWTINEYVKKYIEYAVGLYWTSKYIYPFRLLCNTTNRQFVYRNIVCFSRCSFTCKPHETYNAIFANKITRFFKKLLVDRTIWLKIPLALYIFIYKIPDSKIFVHAPTTSPSPFHDLFVLVWFATLLN